MSDKAYLLRFKHPELSNQSVTAASAEIRGEHVALLTSKGKLAALFLTEVVESCSESPLSAPNTMKPKDAGNPPDGRRYNRLPELPSSP
jgi:hypothetical protein